MNSYFELITSINVSLFLANRSSQRKFTVWEFPEDSNKKYYAIKLGQFHTSLLKLQEKTDWTLNKSAVI